MSGEYELKKDRDRKFWNGGFLWSGQDYIGEPTPYDVFPVKASFFGAMDTAGFAKDAYYLFRSQWTTEPMVHLVPMDWTSYQPGQPVSVWVYANVATVELFRNGTSLGVKSFDEKVTTYGRKYLETTEPTHDDYNYPSGSYTSPNGSMGKLHLTWTVPFQPGTLTAVATAGGRVVARDEIRTAGAPHALTLTPDRRVISADGTSLAFLAVEVVDRAGVLVPDASPLVQFGLAGPAVLDGVDNGRQENAQSYRLSSVPAFNGRALVIIRSAGTPGRITVSATSAGLAGAKAGLAAAAVTTSSGRGAVPSVPAVLLASSAAGGSAATADASYSGSPGHDPGGHARRRSQHRMVELLRQGQDGQPARGERLQRQRLGVGVLAVAAVLRLGPGLVHDQPGARAARRDYRVVLGRVEVRPGAEPGHQPGHGV